MNIKRNKEGIMTNKDLIQICDEQTGRLEYQRKMLNLILDMMMDTNNTLRYCAEKSKDHDYLGQLKEEHILHKVTADGTEGMKRGVK